MLNAQHVDHIGMQRAKMSVWYSSMKTLLFVARGLKEPRVSGRLTSLGRKLWIFVSPAVAKTEQGEKPLCRTQTDSFHSTWLSSSNANLDDVSRTVLRPDFGSNFDVFPSFGVCCVPVDPLVTSKSFVSQHFPSSFVSTNLMRLGGVSQTTFSMRSCVIQWLCSSFLCPSCKILIALAFDTSWLYSL